MKIRKLSQVGIIVIGMCSLLLPAVPVAAASSTVGGTGVQFSNLLAAKPDVTTPSILTGTDANGKAYEVSALASSGNTVYMGGWFPWVKKAGTSTQIPRQNIAAYDQLTGEIKSFSPQVDGQIFSMALSPDGATLYIAGKFRYVNNVARRSVAALDATTGALKPDFDAQVDPTISMNYATWIEYRCNRLWVSGYFVGIGGNSHRNALATLDPVHGTDTGYQNVAISGQLTGTHSEVWRFDVSPNCDSAKAELTALGDFTSVSGQHRERAFRLRLGADHPSLLGWYNPLFNQNCVADKLQWTRAVTYSPDGSAFDISTTGGWPSNKGATYCDSITRWAVNNLSATAAPLWVQLTGGDSFYSVADTGQMVCGGGHMRWADNPYGYNSYGGHGAVPSPGLVCVSSANGHSIIVTDPHGGKHRWFAPRSRGIGAMALLLMQTSDGHGHMLIGSDATANAGLGCNNPGDGVDCAQDTPSVASKYTGCLGYPRWKGDIEFVDCVGLQQSSHPGLGSLPELP